MSERPSGPMGVTVYPPIPENAWQALWEAVYFPSEDDDPCGYCKAEGETLPVALANLAVAMASNFVTNRPNEVDDTTSTIACGIPVQRGASRMWATN